MTPFGARVRQLRRERGLLLKDMAAHLGVSSAYLSALERGERGKPTWTLLQGVLQYFRIIWDEADELVRLADLSDPKVKIDASTRSPEAVLLANRLARELGALNEEDVAAMLAVLDRAAARPRPERQAPLPRAPALRLRPGGRVGKADRMRIRPAPLTPTLSRKRKKTDGSATRSSASPRRPPRPV